MNDRRWLWRQDKFEKKLKKRKENQGGNNGASTDKEVVTERYQPTQLVGLREGLALVWGEELRELLACALGQPHWIRKEDFTNV